MSAKRAYAPNIIIRALAVIEIAIGLTTLIGVTAYSVLLISKKPLSILIFILASAVISTTLGWGLFKGRDWARRYLAFFSGYIVLTKILIFAGLIRFEGELMTILPTSAKDLASMLYHIVVIILLCAPTVKQKFVKGR